ncbi:hypothetical protein COA01_34930 [Bacillus cereus]|uniref:hypothetical protein n=1 Tax=Bacillus cereus TaxID=1396 RepID=UPI000BFD7AB3|nr:hypothetical protein [Bacillus cereus]PGP12017.1 hypothetical protein COA01_34930 [Bacillus cereus]
MIMVELQEHFEQFLENSPDRLEYLLKLGEDLNNIRIVNVREKVIDYMESKELSYEYIIEFSRSSLRCHLSLVEFSDENSTNGKNVEVLMDGESFNLDTEDIRYYSFTFAEKLFLRIDYATYFLQVFLQRFESYKYVKNYFNAQKD